MRVRRYRGVLSFDSHCEHVDKISYRNIEIIVRDTDDGNREAAFDFVEDKYVYNVFARREDGAWSARYKCSYMFHNDPVVQDSLSDSGMHIEGFSVNPHGDEASIVGVWIEDGDRYSMDYEGLLKSDQLIEND